jgi:hypothetical protein
MKMENRELKSKVMKIANRLSPLMDGDCSAAFVKAWQVVKAGGLELAVKGTSFGNRQEALKRLAFYDPKDIHTFLEPEPDNPYDSNAIAVQVLVNGAKATYRLGYVPKTETGIVKALLGTVPVLKVLNGDIRGARVRIAV